MSIWKKLSENPALVSFHDDTLNMLTIAHDYIHFRLSISSTTYSILEEDLKNVFLNPDENDLYIDMVFLNTKIDTSRGAEINDWLEAHPECTNYVIIDDRTDFNENQNDNFVHINSMYGITDEDMNKAIAILNKN